MVKMSFFFFLGPDTFKSTSSQDRAMGNSSEGGKCTVVPEYLNIFAGSTQITMKNI